MDNSLIDQIRQANDIVDVVQSYVPLKHVGSNWRGICPFHDDTKPSMYVSQPKQIFKCFACGKGGNVFTFVQDYEKLSFMEAVKKLALRAGIQIPEFNRTKVVSTKRQQLLQVYKSAGEFYSESLFNHGENALDYLKKRQISPETAKDLQLGYALPSQKALLNHLMKEGYSVSLLKDSGLFGEYSGALIDIFRDRLIFPIHNNTGEVIAFGGRLMEPKENAGKYINSPGTELYTKGKELYGLFKTKYNISKADCSLVSEGYFDFLRLYESGFTNSVASLGTALTEDQVYLLNRFSSNTVMLYDGDNAGIKAAVRGGLVCLAKGMHVRLAILPEKEDPDSFILNKGAKALSDLIAEAPDLITFIAETDKLALPAKERIEQILDALRLLPDPIQKELFLKEVSQSFGVSQNALLSKLRLSSSRALSPSSPQVLQPALSDDPQERMLLWAALKDRESYNILASELTSDYFNSKLYRSLYLFLQKRLQSAEGFDPAALLDDIDNSEIKECLAELLFEDLHEASVSGLIKDLKLRKLKRDLDGLDKAINEDPGNLNLLKEKDKLSREYRRLTKRVVNKVLY
ncbi:MAG: DNA primase [Candidatus Cloacimonetes bacterium]|nr:DNA primase [Candidatus Cloacimonadota bacterium]MCB5287236.1 DNA primase [Candidatus Cloacimonadota bacterium]MCK9184790.1 DNA primase [Candidatus Cloacimonadota bacterium]MCK9583764.1 DNA primase [Candidatus Cloacimonadota bacterium]MDY0229558.1 DNA primase [Candidatus Cloacimonadaceae bacterium]